MATKKNASKKGLSKKGRGGKGPKQDGSPIKVGGGGGRRKKGRKQGAVIWCDFSHVDYPDPDPGRGPRRKTFENRNWRMKSLTFKFRGKTADLTPFLPADGSCSISIERPRDDNDVEISGAPLGTTFHDGTYQFVDGSNTRHENGNTRPTKVVIKTGGLSIEDSFEPLELWEIKANYLRPAVNRSSKSRRSK